MRNRILAVAGIAGALALTGQPSAGQTAEAAPTPQIEVTGVGEARVTPDRATIFLGVQSRALTAAAAAADNAKRQSGILDTLRALGLSSAQLSTANFNVSPEMQYSQNGQRPRVIGYSVTNTVRVEVRRLADIGRLIDAALTKGANNVSNLQFYSSKADSVRRTALALAVASARADAEALAQAAGGSLGALVELSTNASPGRPVLGGVARGMAAMAEKTPIGPGEQTVSAIVTARWAFVRGRH